MKKQNESFLVTSAAIIASLLLITGCASTRYFSDAPLQIKQIAMVKTGLARSRHHDHYGMSVIGDTMYLTGWAQNKITAISLKDHALVDGFPRDVPTVDYPHGIAADEEDGSFWIADLNTRRLRHFSPDLDLLDATEFGGEIVNLVVYEDKLYVADRSGPGFIFIVDKSSVGIDDVIEFAPDNPDRRMGDMDLFIYDSRLYVCATDLRGFLVMDLDGSNRGFVPVDGLGRDGRIGRGLYVYNDKVFINAESSVLITDLSGALLMEHRIESPTGGEIYIDMHVSDGQLYVASHRGEAPSHVLVFAE